MKTIPAAILAILAAGGLASYAQTVPATPAAPAQQSQPAAPPDSAPAGDGLRDLDAMTFGCPKAGLNAAAREAAKVPSQGTYQFSYFKILNDSHHATYEVHFKSNYEGEPDLRYCVAIYCQQGWDPKTTKVSVRLMTTDRKTAHGAAHIADCSSKPAPPPRPPLKK
jgi:hypothetical protein